jgi:hypothetical protein
MTWFHRTINIHGDEEADEARVGLIEPKKSTSPDNDRDKRGSGRCSSHVGLVGLLILSNLFWIVLNLRFGKCSHSVQDPHNTDFSKRIWRDVTYPVKPSLRKLL